MMSFVEDLNKKSVISIISDFRWFYVWLVFSAIPLLLLWWFGPEVNSDLLASMKWIWLIGANAVSVGFIIAFYIRMKETLWRWTEKHFLHLLAPAGVTCFAQMVIALFLI